ncbi:Ribosomal protein L28/L40, mitochondrial [Niveomyces insectorum RCEF 264]|uniref:Ribosomal protein L28/L40, mitochondrial n=1 Tax=Niveomyces insectorum RCEF 264 TaxID=1081102 RepID=A0A167UQG4_9HYPO|nr:Ribosomal protein L28/L40, mitochondrial [Niveomyces insectorum RCEF 264]
MAFSLNLFSTARATSALRSPATMLRLFSFTRPAHAAPPFIDGRGGSKPRSKRLLAARDPKIKILDKALYKLKFVPPPLRMGRNRYLRHWTIHRAWLLFRRQNRERRERELMQQYQSMHNACEELRHTAGPGLRDLGYLYRVAMEKKGVWRHGGIPIEYARPQTETPAREPWNHDWKP